MAVSLSNLSLNYIPLLTLSDVATTMTGMKKLKDISNEGFALSCNDNVRALLTFKNFLLVLLFQMPYSTI